MPTISSARPPSTLLKGALPTLHFRHIHLHARQYAQRSRITAGTNTPTPNRADPKGDLPFYFDAGYGCFAKRSSRPFPPPFMSPPSMSFSDALSTHDRMRDRRPHVAGEMIRGITNGDDAVLAEKHFIGANDGVGAWWQKERGHAALWSRLILHFWAVETDKCEGLDPVGCLQRAFEHTQQATSEPYKWDGTTTVAGAHLHYVEGDGDGGPAGSGLRPVIFATNIGDSQIMVVRPGAKQEEYIVYKSEGQWHWFDCPFQLGTNSVDTPEKDAVVDKVEIQEGDIVLAMSDGVPDNLWEHEVADKVVTSLREYEEKKVSGGDQAEKGPNGMRTAMQFVAQNLVDAARYIAEDPYAESPYMERAIEEGLPAEGGKLDDISVVAAICRRKE